MICVLALLGSAGDSIPLAGPSDALKSVSVNICITKTEVRDRDKNIYN